MKKSGIYKITNTINGNFYIGSSVNLFRRLKDYLCKLDQNKHSNIHLQRSYNQYGKTSFKTEVICFCDISLLLYLEQQYINSMKPQYNIAKSTSAPMMGRKHSQKSRDRMKLREVRRGKDHPSFGIKWTEERKQNWIKIRTGEKRSQEFKDRQSKTNKINNNFKYLKKHIENSKVELIDNEGNEFSSLAEASIFYGVKPATICDVLKGRSKSIFKKYHIWYKKDNHLHGRYKLLTLVGIRKNYNRYVVEICNNKVKLFLGQTCNLEDAIKLYNKESYKLYQDSSRLNDLDMFYKYRNIIETYTNFQYMKLPLE